MKLFMKILAGIIVVAVGIVLYLMFNFHETAVYLSDYIKTQPARDGRERARARAKDESNENENPSNTKPGSQGESDPPVTDQQPKQNENETVV